MPADENYRNKLLRLYLENRCNPKELEELMVLLRSNAASRDLLSQLQQEFYDPSDKDETITTEQSESIRQNLMQKIKQAPVVSINRRKWWVSVAAAAITILLAAGLYYVLNPFQQKKLAKTAVNKNPLNDVAPGTNKAVLTLADGTTIVLDDASNGNLAQQGNTKVIKLNGKLDYKASGSSASEILYNTISTPRGGQYQIELPDGSQVWLNAASSLRFPTAFAGKERKVEISGEAYFEITKNKSMPFVVKINEAEVQVLGTHFNVMAYNDEAAVKTTLLEGSVKFKSSDNTSTLIPGQQSQLTKDGKVKVVDGVDVDKVVAWKNGAFNFHGEDMDAIGRQLARWYDVEVVNNSKIEGLFYAEDIPKNIKLSEVLKMLQLTGEVSFKVEGRRIIVMP